MISEVAFRWSSYCKYNFLTIFKVLFHTKERKEENTYLQNV